MSRGSKFITRARKLHKNKYDYSQVSYVNVHTKVVIVCPTHGAFQQTPNSHISKRAGCPQCAGKHYFNLDVFLQKAREIHGETYDYSLIKVYRGYEIPVPILCTQHGKFFQTPKAHTLTKHGCPKCGAETAKQHSRSRALTNEQFVIKAMNVHGEQYDYTKSSYTNSNTKVEIGCKKHGPFFQTPNNHISNKRGCPKCGDEKKGGVGGYNEQWFQEYPEKRDNPAQLYVIEMKCNTDNFIKVGITTRTIEQRYSRTKQGKKHIEKVVLLTKHLPLEEAFHLEQQILKELKHHQYFPNHLMDGRTECLKNNPEVLATIASLLYPRGD